MKTKEPTHEPQITLEISPLSVLMLAELADLSPVTTTTISAADKEEEDEEHK